MRQSLKAVMLSLIGVFAPIGPVVASTLALVGLDLITGVLAASKRGERITSRRLRDTVAKTFVYLTVVCAAHLVNTYMAPGFKVLELSTSFVGMSELLSVIENLNSVSGGSLLTTLVSKLNPKPPAQGSTHEEKTTT